MLNTFMAFGAGMATVASPCILLMLPLVLGASTHRGGTPGWAGRHRPALIVGGFVLAFAVVTWLFGASARVLGVPHQALRNLGIAVVMASGLLLLWPGLMDKVSTWLSPLAGLGHRLALRAERPGTGPAGAVGLGMSLGLLWTPCAGPLLASVLALIATQQDQRQAGSMLLAYAVGAGLPMLLLAYGGQALAARVRALARHAAVMRRVSGAMMVATGLAMHWQLDTAVGSAASGWLRRVLSRGQELPEDLMSLTARSAPKVPAPELAGIEQWFNSPGLRLQQLRGKVVLIDFWTYGCSNCVNTLPHVRRWHERYQAQGLVVIGVHTPEFSFERDPAHVQAALRRFDIRYPVALDNRYQTWTAWRNQAWPAVYLVDRNGHVVFQHVGEGAYGEIEQHIRAALQAPMAR